MPCLHPPTSFSHTTLCVRFVAAAEITALIREVGLAGAASIATPVADTLVKATAGAAGDPVDRTGLYRMLTPQGFKRAILQNGHERAESEKMTYTDEVTLVRATGVEVKLVEGSPLNLKITTQADWELAQRIWPVWSSL